MNPVVKIFIEKMAAPGANQLPEFILAQSRDCVSKLQKIISDCGAGCNDVKVAMPAVEDSSAFAPL